MAVQSVRVQIDGAWNVLTYNTLTGKYEKTVAAPGTTSFTKPGGYYVVTVEATDDSGNITTDATGRLTVKEITPPMITIVNPGAGAVLGDQQPQIIFKLRDEANGSGVKLDTMQLTIGSGEIATSTSPGMTCTPVSGGYDCTYTVQTALEDGDHTVSIVDEDNDGNSGSANVTMKIDTTPPTLNVLTPAADLKTNRDTITVSGITNDAGSNVTVVKISVDGTDQGEVEVDSEGYFEKVVPIVVGNNTIVTRSTDGVGKYTEITRLVDVNKIPPTISNIAASPNPVTVGENVLVSATVTDS